jgi:esterase/lipase superfamily enzyme
MNREYHKGYSQELHRDMEALVFGHGGTPLLVFPTSMGRFFEYEDRGMTGVLTAKIEAGELQVFCPDAVDLESCTTRLCIPGNAYCGICSMSATSCTSFCRLHDGRTRCRDWL